MSLKSRIKEALSIHPSDDELIAAVRVAEDEENKMRAKYSGASNYIIPEWQRSRLVASVARARYECEHSIARAARAMVVEAAEAARKATAAIRDDAGLEPRPTPQFGGDARAYAAALLAELEAQDAERACVDPRALAQRPLACAIQAAEAWSRASGLPGVHVGKLRHGIVGVIEGAERGDLTVAEIDALIAVVRSRASLEQAEAALAQHDAQQAREQAERAAYAEYVAECKREIETHVRNQPPRPFGEWLPGYQRERYVAEMRGRLASNGAEDH